MFSIHIDLSKCTLCGACWEVCPKGAIYGIRRKRIFINPSLCNGCYSCVLACPEKAIRVTVASKSK